MQVAAILLALAVTRPCVSTALVSNVPAKTTYLADATHRSLGGVSADFNRDGIADLVVLGDTADWILFGTSSGRLISRPLSSNFVARSVAAGDFDGDGKLDLAMADLSTISVRLGNGDGTFGPERTFAYDVTISAIAAGDFNGDGKSDLLVAGANGLTVFLRNGSGFTPLPVIAERPLRHTLVVADFDGDGKLDLATSSWIDSTISIFRGNGDGTFTLMQQPAYTPDPAKRDLRIAAGDFNGDGKLDLVVSNQEGLHLLFGIGDATFGDGPFLPIDWTSTAGNPQLIGAADWNGDGLPDVIVAGSFALQHFVNAGGRFTAQQVYRFSGDKIPFFIQSVPIGVFPADFDGDGWPDLIELDALGFAATMMSGCPSGSIVRASSPESVVVADPLTLTLYDANGPSTAATTFFDNGMNIGSGSGTLTTSLLTTGMHAITASGTSPLTLTAHAHPSAITMTDSKTATLYGEPIAISGTVTSDTGEKPLFGNVEILDGTSVIATAPVINGSYEASLIEPPKSYDFAARFTGASAWPRSDATTPVHHVVNVAATTISIITSNGLPPASDICLPKFPPRLNGRWGFFAKVSGPFSEATGTLTYSIPALHINDTESLIDGIASFGFDRVPAGRYPYTLTYSGAPGFAPAAVTGTLVIPTCHGHAAAR